VLFPVYYSPSIKKEYRVLFVDDGTEVLAVVSRMLEHLGYKCVTVFKPEEAAEIVSEERIEFDLVISDFSLPGMSGVDLLEVSERPINTHPLFFLPAIAIASLNKKPSNLVLMPSCQSRIT
jgi:CheY-like chemotaxis protein